jgi:hypothetical protein
MKAFLPSAAIVLGLFLFLLSFLWPWMVGTSTVWSEEQAEEYAHAAADLHAKLHEQVHADDGHGGHEGHGHAAGEHEPAVPGSLEAAKARFEESKAGLGHARSVRRGPARFFRWAGVLCFVLGVAGYFVVRGSTD